MPGVVVALAYPRIGPSFVRGGCSLFTEAAKPDSMKKKGSTRTSVTSARSESMEEIWSTSTPVRRVRIQTADGIRFEGVFSQNVTFDENNDEIARRSGSCAVVEGPSWCELLRKGVGTWLMRAPQRRG